jgi:catechol 2,3-dioxygenase
VLPAGEHLPVAHASLRVPRLVYDGLNHSRKAPMRAYGIHPPTYRLPDKTSVGVVHLLVSDLHRSLQYYEQVIGLRPLLVQPQRAVLGSGDGRPLVELQTRDGVTPTRPGAFGLYHFAILLPDRAALGRFAAHIASRDIPVGMADHLVSESLYLRDPDGLGIEVYADRPRSTWKSNGRELAMTTDPLDIGNVIAEGAGVSWDGAPAGTMMGHVHLHVGSLDEAEAFYHRTLGFDKMVWSYPGALFMAAGGYHHHLGTNVWSPGPAPTVDQARLLEWELMLPADTDVAAAGENLRDARYQAELGGRGFVIPDPWGTRVRILTKETQ